MAGTYATDITTLSDGTTGTPTEATAYSAGASFTSNDTDIFLQGISAYSSLSVQKTANAGQSILYNNGAAITATAGHVLSIWSLWPVPSGLSTYNAATPGAQIVVGSAVGTIRTYTVDGSDTSPYGGWKFYTVDLRNAATGATTGYTGTTPQYMGIAYYIIVAFNRSVLFSLDTVRYGRMTMTATSGTGTAIDNVNPLSSSAANFPQMADYNDYNGGGTPLFGAAVDGGYHRFGQCQDIDGGYLLRGVISIGTTASPVYFDDANRAIFINDEYLTYDDFNRIEIRNASSTVKLSSMVFSFIPRSDIITAADAPATPRCNVEMFDNALVDFDFCTFTDMGTFTFLTGATGSFVDDCTFRRCQTVFPKGMSMNRTIFVNTQSANGAVQFDSVSDGENLLNCFFTNNTVGPAIKITAAGTYNFVGHTFSGNTVQVEFSGTGTCTIVPSNDSNVSQANVTATGGGTITVETPAVNVTLTGLKENSEVRAYLGTDPATATEIGGVENSTTSFTFSQSVGGQAGYIQIFNKQYLPVLIELTYSSSNQEIPIQQFFDRQYESLDPGV